MGWIDEVVSSHAEMESPARFHYWSALATLSAVLRKNVYLDRFSYKLYPNIFVFLVAKSGLKKSNPVTFAKRLIKGVNATRVISGRNTIQAILKDLGKAHSVEGGGVLKDASAMIISGELAALLQEDPDALTVLTDLYDTWANEPEWENKTKTSGVDVLRNPCITLLGATNEEHFRNAVPNNAIGGGFIARTHIVLESQRRCVNDLMDPPKVVPSVEEMSKYLIEVAKTTGVFTIHTEAKAEYRKWYHQIATEDHHDATGSMERMGDSVLKVAMLLSISSGLSLELSKQNVEEAIFRCMECVSGLRQVTMGQGKSDQAPATALVLRELLGRPGNMVKRSALLSKYWGEFDSLTLDRIIQTLSDTKAVTSDRSKDGKDVIYVMSQWAVDQYNKYKREIN